jgi:hypothetical protein
MALLDLRRAAGCAAIIPRHRGPRLLAFVVEPQELCVGLCLRLRRALDLSARSILGREVASRQKDRQRSQETDDDEART